MRAPMTAAGRPFRVAAAIVEFMLVGHPLQRDLAGLWAARRGPYRVLYEIDDDPPTVRVVRSDHRADVYRPR